jgi:hypothetical protein
VSPPRARVALLPVLAIFAVSSLPAAAPATTRPAWLTARAGVRARVDVAPWFVSDEPEAALTAHASSLQRDFTGDATRPEDVVYEPIGVRVRFVRRAGNGRLALVRGTNGDWEAFAPLGRLVPEIPPGTGLRVAGGFGGFADFYPTLATRPGSALEIATGTDLTAIAIGVAPYDSALPEFVRVRVRVMSGPMKDRTGWIGTSYVGVPATALPAEASVAETACRCVLVRFGGP